MSLKADKANVRERNGMKEAANFGKLLALYTVLLDEVRKLRRQVEDLETKQAHAPNPQDWQVYPPVIWPYPRYQPSHWVPPYEITCSYPNCH